MQRLPARPYGVDRHRPGGRAGAEGPRPLGVEGEVQLGAGAALRAALGARRGGAAAVALPEGHLHRRHERGAEGAGARAGQGPVAQRGEPPEGAMGREACTLEPT